MNNMELIMTRKSVRTFDGSPLTDKDKKKLCAFIATIKNPYDIPVEFVLLDAKVMACPALSFKANICTLPERCKKQRTVKRPLGIPLNRWCFMPGRSVSVPPGLAAP